MKTAVDTYSFLLAHPTLRQIGLCGAAIEHCDKSFSKEIYEEGRRVKFDSYDEAYSDWLLNGRRLGLAYAPGKNTVLKIILKVKDEPELLPVWIEYHASIVGYENLVVLDTGSRDERHLQILNEYKHRLLIFDYRKYYDHIHSTQSNRPFFDLLSRNCRYLALLDADEFLVSLKDGSLSRRRVTEDLAHSDATVYAATWLHNATLPAREPSEFPAFERMAFSMDIAQLRNGTIAGKSIARSSVIFAIQHLGHNLHVKEVVQQLTPDSFGKFFVFHLSYLHPTLARQRLVKHLRSLGALPAHLIREDEIGAYLELHAATEMSQQARSYADRFRTAAATSSLPQENVLRTSLLSSEYSDEPQPGLITALTDVGFPELLSEYAKRFGLSANELHRD